MSLARPRISSSKGSAPVKLEFRYADPKPPVCPGAIVANPPLVTLDFVYKNPKTTDDPLEDFLKEVRTRAAKNPKEQHTVCIHNFSITSKFFHSVTQASKNQLPPNVNCVEFIGPNSNESLAVQGVWMKTPIPNHQFNPENLGEPTSHPKAEIKEGAGIKKGSHLPPPELKQPAPVLSRKVVVDLDADGCVFNDRYKAAANVAEAKRIIDANKGLLDFFEQRYRQSRSLYPLILMSGSYRQTPNLDLYNALTHKTSSMSYALIEMEKYFKTQLGEKCVSVDRYTLSDTATNVPSGTNFKLTEAFDAPSLLKAENEVLRAPHHSTAERASYALRTHAELAKAAAKTRAMSSVPDSIVTCDKQKIFQLYVKMHRLAAQTPEGCVVDYHFCDDRLDILKGLQWFYDTYPEMRPKNVNLHLFQYGPQKEPAPVWSSDPSNGGEIDRDYEGSLTKLHQIWVNHKKSSSREDAESKHGPIDQEYDFISHLKRKQPADSPFKDFTADCQKRNHDCRHKVHSMLRSFQSTNKDLKTRKQEKSQYLLHRIRQYSQEELMYLYKHMNQIQRGETTDEFFNDIREERYNIFASGNTDTWRNLCTVVKSKILGEVKRLQTSLDAKTYEGYHKLFAQHHGRSYGSWGKTDTLKEFKKTYSAR